MSKVQGDGKALSPLLVHNCSDGFNLNFVSTVGQTFATSGAIDIVTAYAFPAIDYLTAGRFTVKHAGYYVCNAGVTFLANATGARSIYIYVNGAAILSGGTVSKTNDGAAIDSTVQIHRAVKLAAGDIIDIRASQASTASLASTDECWWTLFPISEKMGENSF